MWPFLIKMAFVYQIYNFGNFSSLMPNTNCVGGYPEGGGGELPYLKGVRKKKLAH